MNSNKKFVIGVVAAIVVAIVCVLGVNVYNNSKNYGFTGGVAATVNGAEIQEDKVTKYIQDYRMANGLESEDAWGKMLATNGTEVNTLRSQVIENYVQQELINQACSENDVTVESSEVDSYVDQMKKNFSDDKAWEEALSNAGMTVDEYRTSIENSLKEEKLQDAVVSEDDLKVSDKERNEWVSSYGSYISGAKRSSHILFSAGDEETAKKVLEQIKSGDLSFEDAVAQYSKDEGSAQKGGDCGWDAINNFVTDYATALDGLDKGELSGLVTSEYGIHIIKCTDVFTCDDKTTFKQLPEDIRTYVDDFLSRDKKSQAYSTWFDKFKEQADIVINDMPENVPYNIDLTTYQEAAAAAAQAAQESAEEDGSGE